MLEVKEVDDITYAFPADIVGKYLPNKDDIPKEFWRLDNEWSAWAGYLFYRGGAGLSFYPKEGIDPSKAFRHVMTCLRSFQPSHEHKEAGVAYLLSEFFEKIEKEKDDKATSDQSVQTADQ